MEGLYQIEFKYLGSLNEPWHTANVVVYDTMSAFGANVQHALDVANDDGDYSGLDKLLQKTLDVKDDEVIYYLDLHYVDDSSMGRETAMVLEIQRSMDILINAIDCVEGV